LNKAGIALEKNKEFGGREAVREYFYSLAKDKDGPQSLAYESSKTLNIADFVQHLQHETPQINSASSSSSSSSTSSKGLQSKIAEEKEREKLRVYKKVMQVTDRLCFNDPFKVFKDVAGWNPSSMSTSSSACGPPLQAWNVSAAKVNNSLSTEQKNKSVLASLILTSTSTLNNVPLPSHKL